MKLQFDPNQQFQLDAIAAVTDLFDGQPQSAPDYALIKMGTGTGLYAGQEQAELGVGDREAGGPNDLSRQRNQGHERLPEAPHD